MTPDLLPEQVEALAIVGSTVVLLLGAILGAVLTR